MIPILTACTMDSLNGRILIIVITKYNPTIYSMFSLIRLKIAYKHMFYLVSPLKTHAFVCTNKDDKSAWVQKINQVIAELVSSNPVLAGTRLF